MIYFYQGGLSTYASREDWLKDMLVRAEITAIEKIAKGDNLA